MRWWCVVCVVWLCPLSYFGCLCGPAQTEKQSFNLLHVLYLITPPHLSSVPHSAGQSSDSYRVFPSSLARPIDRSTDRERARGEKQEPLLLSSAPSANRGPTEKRTEKKSKKTRARDGSRCLLARCGGENGEGKPCTGGRACVKVVMSQIALPRDQCEKKTGMRSRRSLSSQGKQGQSLI